MPKTTEGEKKDTVIFCSVDESCGQKDCKCACHDNKLKKPEGYSHSSICCGYMNGYLEEKK
jgi:hypothetical protein